MKQGQRLAHGESLRYLREDRQIRAMKGTATQVEIASRFRISQTNVSAIHRGAIWGWL